MMSQCLRLMSVIFVSALFVVSAFAEGDKAATNGEIVVTATRTPTPYSDVPAGVTVLGEAQVNMPAIRNVDDALRSVSGVSLLKSYGMGFGIPSQINIRGVPGLHRTLLLADGIPMAEAASGFINMNEVPVNCVRQVEVVRGPFSALYGTDALSGVINLLTRNPGEGPSLITALSAGNEGFLQGYVSAGAGSRSRGVIVTVDSRTIDNYLGRDYVVNSQFNPQTGQYVELRKDAENYDYSDTRVMAKAMLDIGNDWHVDFHGRFFDGYMGYGTQDLIPAENESDNMSALVGAELSGPVLDDGTCRLLAFYRRQDRDGKGLDFSHVENGMPVYVPSISGSSSDDWKLDARMEQRVNSRNDIMFGAEIYGINGEFEPVRNEATGLPLPMSAGRDADVNGAALYVQHTARAGENFLIVPGLRVDRHSEFGAAWSPRIGVAGQVSRETKINASVGTAYRAPSLMELFQPDIAYGSIVFVSNPDLQPEYINSADAGGEHKLTDNLTVKAGIFYNDMDDLIDNRMNGATMTYVNVQKAWSAGGEIGLEYRALDMVALTVNYTRQESEDRDTGIELAYVPANMANAAVRIDGSAGQLRHEISLIEQYMGERGTVDLQTGMWRELDAYWRTDLSYKLSVGGRWWLAAGAQNLLDRKYDEWVGNLAPARLWTVEIGVSCW